MPRPPTPETRTTPAHRSAKKRKPAWTDRILWKVKAPVGGPSPSGRESHRLQVTQHSYRSHMEYTVSDHKPVAAQFVLQVSPGLSIPQSTGNPCTALSSICSLKQSGRFMISIFRWRN